MDWPRTPYLNSKRIVSKRETNEGDPPESHVDLQIDADANVIGHIELSEFNDAIDLFLGDARIGQTTDVEVAAAAMRRSRSREHGELGTRLLFFLAFGVTLDNGLQLLASFDQVVDVVKAKTNERSLDAGKMIGKIEIPPDESSPAIPLTQQAN